MTRNWTRQLRFNLFQPCRCEQGLEKYSCRIICWRFRPPPGLQFRGFGCARRPFQRHPVSTAAAALRGQRGTDRPTGSLHRERPRRRRLSDFRRRRVPDLQECRHPELKPRFKKASYTPETRGFESSFVRMKTVGANPNPRAVGIDRLPGVTNYFIGNDPAKWRTNVAGYAKVKYEGVYPGIDLVYYDNGEGRLEYDFIVAPGADPKQIALSIEDAQSVEVDPSGDLVISAVTGTIRKPSPKVYQEIDGKRQEITAGYRLLDTRPSYPRHSDDCFLPRRLRPQQTARDRPADPLRDLSRRLFDIDGSERRSPRRCGGRSRFGLCRRSHDIDELSNQEPGAERAERI